MEQYIPKSAVVAEIEKIKEGLQRNCNPNPLGNTQECLAAAEIEALDLVVNFVNSLEVKEVDLEKEYKEFIQCTDGRSMFETAKHFFELGLNASNPLTWEDMRDIYDLAYNLRFPHKKQKDFFEEVLKRFKERKEK